MSDGRRDRSGDEPGGQEQDQRLQREREQADPREQDAATGPGYTARPTTEEPEEGEGTTR
jgi:hypothetical protein